MLGLYSLKDPVLRALKTKGGPFDDFVTDGTVECRNDNLRMRKWRQSFQYV